MKFIVSTKDLRESLAKVIQAVPSGKSNTPILSGVLIKTVGATVEIEGNNLNMAIKSRIAAEVEEDGVCVVNAKNLFAIAAKLSGSVTTIIYTGEGTAVIKSDATTFELYTMEADDFPEFNIGNIAGEFSIYPAPLKQIISRTTFAVSDDDSRPVFTGVNLMRSGNSIVALATNTHRLAKFSLAYEDELPEFNFIVPVAAMNAIKNLLNDRYIVKVFYNDRVIKVECGETSLATRLIDGTFPPTDKTCAVEEKCKAVVATKSLLESVGRVDLIAKQTEYHAVKVKIDDEGIELAADSYATGKVVEHLSADIEGEIEIAFNLSYLADFLKVTDAENIIITANNSSVPAKFVGDNDEAFQYIVTPVRV